MMAVVPGFYRRPVNPGSNRFRSGPTRDRRCRFSTDLVVATEEGEIGPLGIEAYSKPYVSDG